MGKREYNKVQHALEKFAEAAGLDSESLKQEMDLDALYTQDDNMYEGQAVINFFRFRIKPILEGKKPGESNYKFKQRTEEWEKAYHEWRIRECDQCHMEFAYALDFEGVKFCSLYCLDAALAEIGLKVTRGRDLRKRWGVQFHPAIVPSTAFAALKQTYEDRAEESFVP